MAGGYLDAPVGESCHARLENLPRSLPQRPSTTHAILIKGISNDSIVAQVFPSKPFPRKSQSGISAVAACNLPPASRVVSPGAGFVRTTLYARSAGVFRNIWWRPV